MSRICAEILARLSDDREWERFTEEWYHERQWQDPVYLTDQLFDWEAAALRLFPEPPSTILIFAAGKGREVRAVQKKDHQVFAVEMDIGCCESIRANCDPRQMIGLQRASFLDVACGVEKLPQQNFSGIIIGWAAIIHMPSQDILFEFFRILRASYPNVPVLVSTILISPPLSLLHRLLRSSSTSEVLQQGFRRSIHPWYGPCGHIDIPSLEQLFRSVGYDFVCRNPNHDYPHWVLS